MTEEHFVEWCMHRHDVVCNQKYGRREVPYSFHLKSVIGFVDKYKYLLPQDDHLFAIAAAAGHDLIEDARVSYNDIKQRIGHKVAETIFLCTEMRGRTRDERKSDQFYEEMKVSDLAVFVKLCDIMANTTYSICENSSMLKKAKAEWPRIRHHLYRKQFEQMFTFLDKLYQLEEFTRVPDEVVEQRS